MRIRFQIWGVYPVGYASFRKGAPSRKLLFWEGKDRLRAALHPLNEARMRAHWKLGQLLAKGGRAPGKGKMIADGLQSFLEKIAKGKKIVSRSEPHPRFMRRRFHRKGWAPVG